MIWDNGYLEEYIQRIAPPGAKIGSYDDRIAYEDALAFAKGLIAKGEDGMPLLKALEKRYPVNVEESP
jgi:hypothetical protein